MPLLSLPIDVLELIMKDLASMEAQQTRQGDGRPSDLASCSLVAKELVDIAQRCLFHAHTVILGRERQHTGPESTLRFMRTVIENPKIGSYVRNLVYCVDQSDLESKEVAEGLGVLSNIVELRIKGPYVGWQMPSLDSPWGGALLSILVRGTIDRLKLVFVSLSLSALSRISANAGKLDLAYVTVIPDDVGL